jgi:type VI secretion system secreted protein Hcp
MKGGDVVYTGESKHKKHAGKIQLLAWSWGMSQSGSFGHGSGGGAGKANIQDISVTKYLDKSSTQFMKALTTGAHADSAILYVSKAGGTQDDYLKITLTSVMITSYSTGGSGGEDMLTENISLAFAKFDIAYSTQDDKGKVSEAGTVQYSVEEVA